MDFKNATFDMKKGRYVMPFVAKICGILDTTVQQPVLSWLENLWQSQI